MSRRGIPRFTPAEADAIRNAVQTRSYRDVSREYDVHPDTIYRLVKGYTYRTDPPWPPDCPCPVCIRASRPIDDYDEAPATVNLHHNTLRSLRAVAREFDSASVRCPWHRTVLLIGQRCSKCDFVRLPTSASDFMDYLAVAREDVA